MDEAITQKLFALQDETYQAFQSKLMPTVSPETIIGVRTPLLRKLAKELSGTARAEAFLRSLPLERGQKRVQQVAVCVELVPRPPRRFLGDVLGVGRPELVK